MQHSENVFRSQRDEQVSAARVILQTLADRGVKTAFGIPGGLISPIFDALADVPEFTYVATRHEAMAGFAAMGHALATGKPALVLTTGGPGLTNVVTAAAAALLEELPMIVIAGDVPIEMTSRGGFHDTSPGGLDGLALMRTVTRFSARIESTTGIATAVEHALRIATGPRPGPVFLSLPVSIGGGRSSAIRTVMPEPAPAPAPDRAACAEIAMALLGARRPLLVVGNGARAAAPEVLALAERVGTPVVTTPHAKGVFPDSHPLHVGGIGFGGHPSASDYVNSGPDVVLVVGSRLGDYSTNGWTLPLRGTKATYHIDRESWVIGRNYEVTMGLVADATAALRGILSALPKDVGRPLRLSVPRRLNRPESVKSNAVPLHPGRIMRALQKAFPDAMFAVDTGEHCAIALHYLTIDRPDQFFTMTGLASMGNGFGMAIGYRHARNDRSVVAIIGDGSFSMHAGEILTLVETGIDPIIVVMNDGRWNMVDKGFSSVFGRLPAAMPEMKADLAGVAREFGAVGARLSTPEDLSPDHLRSYLGLKRPVLLDARFDSSESLSVLTRGIAVKRVASSHR